MKKILPILVALILFLSTNLFALGLQIGIYGGKDIYHISKLGVNFQLMDMTEATIEREGRSNPWLLGMNLYYNLKNDLKLGISAEAAYLAYKVHYSRNYPTVYDPFNIKTSKYDLAWARAAILASLVKDVLSTSVGNFYVGIGGGLHVLAPVVSDKFVFDTLWDKFMELDTSTDINLIYKFGGFAIFGFQFNPFQSPIKLQLEGKYHLTSQSKYEEPDNFLSVDLGLLYFF